MDSSTSTRARDGMGSTTSRHKHTRRDPSFDGCSPEPELERREARYPAGSRLWNLNWSPAAHSFSQSEGSAAR